MRSRVARSVQTDPVPRARSRSADPVPRVQRIYERRHFSPSELNDAGTEAILSREMVTYRRMKAICVP
ncbi:hypothetical protein Tcan_06173 [Toxocara canis]|uniref:Uncharacterized protein n=1 Tax=Toxocara canis TaxID=6265 RepID=A0A0B2VWH5_TOXCA|nr:hypothetical protein Tcan_06173 [Toxocara canis]